MLVPEYRQLLILAEDPNSPPEVLNGLLDKIDSSHNWHLFYNLSLNPNTPADALTKLSELCLENGYRAVIRHINKHPNTPERIKNYINAINYVNSIRS